MDKKRLKRYWNKLDKPLERRGSTRTVLGARIIRHYVTDVIARACSMACGSEHADHHQAYDLLLGNSLMKQAAYAKTIEFCELSR
jgi:hypothetical protein